MDEVGVAVCQLAPVLGDVEGNVARAVQALQDAHVRGANVVVLPELATSGYCFESVDELRTCAEPATGRSVRRLEQAVVEAAGGSGEPLVVVAGFAEVDEEGRLRNSAVVIDAAGPRRVYRKSHLWDFERELFVPGDEPPAVVQTAGGGVGVCICYEREFPELVRAAALGGADVLCAPTNWPRTGKRTSDRPIEVVRAQASASVNRMFVAACDRAGAERGTEWVEGSVVAGPDGRILTTSAPDGGEQTLLARCRLGEARDKRTSPRNDAFADRRPELYATVVQHGEPLGPSAG